jgi:hypothetical protein
MRRRLDPTKPLDPAKHVLHGDGYYQRGGPRVTLADFRRAVDAFRGGNQTAFGVHVMGCKDGRQVRRWYAGSSMSYDAARRFNDWRESAEGKAALLGQRELLEREKRASSSSRRRSS